MSGIFRQQAHLHPRHKSGEPAWPHGVLLQGYVGSSPSTIAISFMVEGEIKQGVSVVVGLSSLPRISLVALDACGAHERVCWAHYEQRGDEYGDDVDGVIQEWVQ